MKKSVQVSNPAFTQQFNPDQYVRNGISKQTVIECKQSYDLFDVDASGSIDVKELKAGMQYLGFDLKNASIFKMFSDIDKDGSGKIEFKEWLDMITTQFTGERSSKETVFRIFELYDDDKTGYLTFDKLLKVAGNMGEPIQQSQLHEMFNRADTDRDGLVSAEQFYKIVTKDVQFCPNRLG